jgi:hypothetical protein
MRTCTHCGFINTQEYDLALCPNCGASYIDSATLTDVPAMPPTGARPGYAIIQLTDAPPPVTDPTPSPYPPVPAPPPPPVAPRSRNMIPRIVVAGIAIVALLGGIVWAFASFHGATPVAAAATATPTLQLQPTQANGAVVLTNYTDPNGQFSIKVPPTWTVGVQQAPLGDGQANVTAFNTDGAMGIVVVVSPQSIGTNGVNMLLLHFGKPPFQSAATQSATPVTLRSGLWLSTWGTITGKNGGVANAVLLTHPQSFLNYAVLVYAGPKILPAQTLPKGLMTILNTLSPTAGA